MDFISSIITVAIGEAVLQALKASKPMLKELKIKLLSSEPEIEESLNHHLQGVKNWSEEVFFKGLGKPKNMKEIFIDLDLNVSQIKTRINDDEKNEKLRLSELLNVNEHIVLSGQLGAGKTTSMKFLCNQLLFQKEKKFQSHFINYPILIKCRNLSELHSKKSILFKKIAQIYGLQLEKSEEISQSHYEQNLKKFICKFLDAQNVLVIIDGLDELPNKELEKHVIIDLRILTNHLENSKIIATSRSASFDYSIDQTREFEIAPLTKRQIKKFTLRWLQETEKSDKFLKNLASSPYSNTAIRPLLLANLCTIFEKSGHIPDKPKTVYEKIINLYLEKWDEERSVKRYSNYSDFETPRKSAFLSHVAFELTTKFYTNSFSSSILRDIYNKIYINFDLTKGEEREVIQEIESHTGIIYQSSQQTFEFAHKSIQEYLTAVHIVKLPTIPDDLGLLLSIPNELAISISISSDPSYYFEELISERFEEEKLDETFLKPFINRLIIEKPSFTLRDSFIPVILSFYDLYIKKVILKPVRRYNINEAEFDDLTKSFIKLMGSILKTNPKAKIFIEKRYELLQNLVLNNGEEINFYKSQTDEIETYLILSDDYMR